MDTYRFHPQFRGLLNALLRDAPTFFIRWPDDPTANAQSADRPIFLDESLTLNASVGRAKDGFAQYVVTAGTVAAFFDIARTTSATDQFVQELPITGKAMQTRTFRPQNHFIDYSELTGALGEPIPLIPLREVFEDPIRDALSFVFLDLLFRFLMLHEQMHFVRGHLHYLYGVDTPGAYEEIPTSPISQVESLDRKAMELDADGSALFFLMESAEYGLHRSLISSLVARFPGADEALSIFKDEWGWIRITNVAALTVMMLISLRDPTSQVHPSIETRMLSLLGNMKRYTIEKVAPKVGEGPPQSFTRLFRDVAVVSEILQVSPPSTEAWLEWNNAHYDDFRHPACIELRDLMKRTQELIPKLR